MRRAWLALACVMSAGCFVGSPTEPTEICYPETIYITFDPKAVPPIVTDSIVEAYCEPIE